MKKKYITKEETPSGKNTKSIDKTSEKVKENKELVKKAEKGDLPGYHVVTKKDGDKYLRSNPDKKKNNNLDPKGKA